MSYSPPDDNSAKRDDGNTGGAPISDQTLYLLQEAEDLKFSGQHQEAIDIVEKILFDDPSNVAALEEIADNFLSLNKFKNAEKAAKRALSLDPNSYTSLYILGFIHSHRQQWDEATRCLSQSNQIHPNNPEILRCLGWALFNNHEEIKGIVTLERALNLDPSNILTLCDLGMCYLHSQEIDKALSLFYKSLEMDPNNQRAKECILIAQGIHAKFKPKSKPKPQQ